MILTAAVALLVAGAMEGWAAFMHGQLWHGVLWPAHKSHHPQPVPGGGKKRSTWEFNDVFGVLHALIAAPLIAWGLQESSIARHVALGTGLGMTAFGFAYAIVHDGLVHGRLPVGLLQRSALLRKVAAAHRVHHKLGGPPYGLFSGPWVLRRQKAARKAATAARLAQMRQRS